MLRKKHTDSNMVVSKKTAIHLGYGSLLNQPNVIFSEAPGASVKPINI
jgi:hypothetical protein